MFSNQTYENLIRRILDNAKANNLDTREGSISFNLIAPLVEELAKAYISMGDILNLAFIEDALGEYLEKRVNEFGVYRKDGEKATGAIRVSGEDEAYIENGSIVVSNGLEFIVLNDIMLPFEDVIYVEALDIGYQYNLPAGSVFEPKDKKNGINFLVSEEDFKNGVGIETDEELKERFKYLMQNPRTSGNANNYKEWALACDGVGRVKVYPLWNGNGTVKVLVIGTDNLPCTEEQLEMVKNYIEEKRPIGATVTIDTPEVIDVTFDIDIKLSEVYSAEYAKEEITEVLTDYIRSIDEEDVIYMKALAAVAKLESVADVVSFTINGKRVNIEVTDFTIPVISNINVTVSGVV